MILQLRSIGQAVDNLSGQSQQIARGFSVGVAEEQQIPAPVQTLLGEAATELIIRSADGVLRKCRNLCLSAMLEAVRASAGRTIDIDLVNRVLLQPHWQKEVDLTDF